MSTKQEPASSLKTGKFVVFDGIVCKVNKVDISKTGKHGHAKCRVDASSIIDGRRIIKIMPGTTNVDIPIIEKRSAQVLSIRDNIANVMDNESYETFDLEIPDELKGKIKEGSEVIYWIMLDQKIMKEAK